ncbi:MAG: signal peptidase II [Desulfatiglandales bacterium]
MKRQYHLLALLALAVVVLDQISKFIIDRSIPLHEFVTVISGFFNLVHVRNRGMAFGLMNRPGNEFSFYFLVAATIGAVALLLFWFSRLKKEERSLILGISLILGGALGNLIDRIRFHEVIDFLDFYIGSYHWPAFNVADSAITIGTLWVAINMLFHKKA